MTRQFMACGHLIDSSIMTNILSLVVVDGCRRALRHICVDNKPAVVTELSNRGSSQTVGIVNDVGLFLRALAGKTIQ